ncbi:hypothetical protein V6N13_025552 [Hibiscus sabdariffa]|uniref:Uncharacterized protein n=1 Tax=Hibiscus sabdariffa TaxID=183260 RepID=A0ABR2P8W3_9ROSI
MHPPPQVLSPSNYLSDQYAESSIYLTILQPSQEARTTIARHEQLDCISNRKPLGRLSSLTIWPSAFTSSQSQIASLISSSMNLNLILLGLQISLFFNTMDMKKISCAIIVVAASMSTVMAASSPAPAPAPSLSPSLSPESALVPGPDSSFATATLPVLASLIGASLVSFFASYLQ